MQSAVHAHGCAKAEKRGVLKVAPEQLPFSVHQELKNSSSLPCSLPQTTVDFLL